MRPPRLPPWPRRGAGLPLAVHLWAVVLVPLLTIAALAGIATAGRLTDARRSSAVEQDLDAVRQLETVRTALDQEILPTLLTAQMTRSYVRTGLAVGPALTPELTLSTPEDLRSTRSTTDVAFSTVRRGSPAATAAFPAHAQLLALRSEVDHGLLSASDVPRSYLQVVGGLISAETAMVIEATAEGLTPTASMSSYDALLTTQLAQASTSRLPLLLAARFDDGGDTTTQGASDWQAWLTAWGSYSAVAGRVEEVSSPVLRTRWREITDPSALGGLDAELASRTLSPDAPLSGDEIASLQARSGTRDQQLTDVQIQGVESAMATTETDREGTRRRAMEVLVVSVLALLLSAGSAFMLGLTTTRSLRSLATAARQISAGDLVDVVAGGPREVRTVGATLADAVAGLRRVRDQAAAVARGDLSDTVLASPLPGALGEVMHASLKRIVDAMRARDQLQGELVHAATHDPLTSLPNRSQVVRLAQAALARGRRSGTATGLLFIDLDHFKVINDTFGQACGDEVLRVVATRMARVVRGGDVVGRLGGDEFVVLVENAHHAHDLVQLAQRLVEAVSEPVSWRGHTAVVGACVGIAMDLDASADVETLLHEADIALNRARSHGSASSRPSAARSSCDHVELFDEAMREELAAHAAMEDDLRAALATGGLELAYQPVVNPVTGSLDGFEALCRWDRPGVGRVAPDVFIPVAEASDLVNDLGRWALLEATRQLGRWTSARGADAALLQVGVNISGRHIVDSRVLTDVADALTASGLAPQQLALEITETVLVDDPAADEHLRALRAMGCRVAIDDFGTGFTSLGQIGRMPADVLKIDRSFVSSDEPGDLAVGALAMAAAHTVGMVIIAEGAETREQVEWLVANDCDLVQGYYFSRPLPLAEAAALACGAELPWTPVTPTPVLSTPVLSTPVPGADHGKSIQPDVVAQV